MEIFFKKNLYTAESFMKCSSKTIRAYLHITSLISDGLKRLFLHKVRSQSILADFNKAQNRSYKEIKKFKDKLFSTQISRKVN